MNPAIDLAALPPNARRLLLHLMENGPTHRADLARALDVSRTTITNLTTGLQKDQLVEVINPEASLLKRPLATTAHLGTLVSIVFFGEVCAQSITTIDVRYLHESTCEVDDSLPPAKRLETALEILKDSYRELDLDLQAIRGIHLALDTQVNTETGDIHAEQASARWYGVNPLQALHQDFDVPVVLENSVRLAGLAEALWGAGEKYRDVLYVRIKIGATCSHVRDRAIASGAHGGAGELGHLVYRWDGPLCACGNRGCAMEYMSVPALLRDYRQHSGEDVTWSEFVKRAHAGDPIATELSEDAAVVCARTLVNVTHILDPQAIIINDTGVAKLPGFIAQVRSHLTERALPLIGRNVEVIPSTLPNMVESTARAGIHTLRHHPQVQAAIGANGGGASV
ncbi:MAG: ROK family transcriptional regulator [Actinomycetaceae bacterium]|nr:ROK family transcriptional regulator [Actinomycetaceae bacterium]